MVENGAPSGEKVVVFYNPPVVNAELGIRRPYLKEASRLATPILRARVPTIVFTGSRLAEEVVLIDLKAAVERAPAFTDVIRGYRGGYLPNRRREVERGLRAGDVLGVVSTNALELGIDIGRLDVALLAGYPGTVASTWQQAGRAGRRSGLSAAILVASSAPLDQFIVTHPDYFFGAPPEHGLINPDNPYVLASHLKCAAFELPFAEDEPFGAEDVGRYLRLLEEEGLLHRTGGRYHWTSETYPADHLSLRSVASDNFVVIDSTHQTLEPVEAVRRLTRKREVIAEVDWRSAFAMVHPKAIYLIEGQQYEVQELRFREDEEKVAYVKRVQVDYFTDAVTAKGVWALDRFQSEATGGAAAGRVEQGELLVAEQVVGFKKIKFDTMENVGAGEVDAAPAGDADLGALAHAAPRGARRGLARPRRARRRPPGPGVPPPSPGAALPHVRRAGPRLLARRRRPSRAGQEAPRGPRVLTTERTRARLLAADQFEPTVYLYDSQPGGVGLTERLFELIGPLLARARETIRHLLLPVGLPVVRRAGERGRPPGEADGGHAPRPPDRLRPGTARR